jgi:hypothetical protein
MLPLLEEVNVTIEQAEHVPLLEPLRSLKHLRRLKLRCPSVEEVDLPLFIPPSLKSLHLDTRDMVTGFHQLAPVLQASGAMLEEIEVHVTRHLPAEVGAALAQVLRTCSSTLKTVRLRCHEGGSFGPACIGEVVAGVMSCCATLEVLCCPWAVFSALPATCPAFSRLTELRVVGGRDESVDLASPAWDIMANGRLPALATFCVDLMSYFYWSERVEGEGSTDGPRGLGRALEAVGGTLRRLTLTGSWGDGPPAGACYELGAAIGKLPRLRHLRLDLPADGRHGHDVGRGMAASGGCPELFQVRLQGLKINVDCIAYEPSLIVPSVRNLVVGGRGTEEEALLLCCGLVQAGYRHGVWISVTAADGRSPCLLQLEPVCGPLSVLGVWVPTCGERVGALAIVASAIYEIQASTGQK